MRIYKLSLVAALAVGSLLAGTNVSSAQGTNQVKKGMEGVAADRAERMAKGFNLTADQKAKVLALFEDDVKKTREVQADTSVPPQQKREKLRAIREESDKKLKTIFTPEQWDKMQKQRDEMRQRVIEKKAEMEKKAEQKTP